ncbi:hypothetical protein [Paenibacillus oceani]|uniref:Uncharacterized protein n=1 Tax=Paenibacillus oceani TaxID=2772510 RepID=A0A927H4P6_9BACL|nr:hypothetical protein [Paenibacillus oceani]MBD2866719.1 hypothetical protein [Paenibacillus oceani]
MDDKPSALGRVIHVLDSDPDVHQMIEQSEEDLKQGKIYTTGEIIEQIKQGKL